MADDLQIPGGSAETEDLHVAPARALRVDYSNWELRLHDGVTPGGYRILNLNQLFEIFQLQNPELDGLAFSAAAKGFLTRVAPGQYVVRTLKVNTGQLTLTNAQGLSDDPEIGLADTIETDHTWDGNHVFQQQIRGVGGFLGDVSGDVEGGLTGNVLGNVTGDLAGDSVGSHTGNVDVRGHAFLADAGSLDYSLLDPTSIPSAPDAIPAGFIGLWSGAADAIPTGWLLCDGTNATPDLRGQFIVGAGGDLDVAETGGTTNHNHTINIDADGVHNHTASTGNTAITISQMPAHHHGSGVCDTSALAFNHGTMAAVPTAQDIQTNSGSSGVVESLTTDTGGSTGHNHTVTVDDSGSHTHAVSSDLTDNLPPYYALCYIMKA